MKKLNRKFIKGTNWALAGLMSFLGFSSCEKETAVEYGVPHAEYIVSGKVTDIDGNVLQGVRVIVPGVDHCHKASYPRVTTTELNDTLYTNRAGGFDYSYGGFPTDTVKIKLKFDDVTIDSYESDSTTVSYINSDLEGGKKWFAGKAEKEVNIKLRKK